MKYFALFAALLVVSGCETATVADQADGSKLITMTSTQISYPPQHKFLSGLGRTEFLTKASDACPTGYTIISEQYIPETEGSDDMYQWTLRCS